MSKETKMAQSVTYGDDVTNMEETAYITVKKRVGGGFKYVKVKLDNKLRQDVKKKEKERETNLEDESEKHELENSEKVKNENLKIVSLLITR